MDIWYFISCTENEQTAFITRQRRKFDENVYAFVVYYYCRVLFVLYASQGNCIVNTYLCVYIESNLHEYMDLCAAAKYSS